MRQSPSEKPRTKNQLKQQILESAISAHKKQGNKENTTYDITLPERLPYEANATMKQKDYLWGLGIRDQAILDSLGKWQASAMIDQISNVRNPG
jgi:hypothetical protein